MRLRAFWARHPRPIVAATAGLAVTGWTLFLLVNEQLGGVFLVAAITVLCPFVAPGSAGADTQPEGPLGKSELGSGPFI